MEYAVAASDAGRCLVVGVDAAALRGFVREQLRLGRFSIAPGASVSASNAPAVLRGAEAVRAANEEAVDAAAAVVAVVPIARIAQIERDFARQRHKDVVVRVDAADAAGAPCLARIVLG